MKNTKIIGLTLALIISMSMTACSNTGSVSEAGSSGTEPASTASVEKNAEEVVKDVESGKEEMPEIVASADGKGSTAAEYRGGDVATEKNDLKKEAEYDSTALSDTRPAEDAAYEEAVDSYHAETGSTDYPDVVAPAPGYDDLDSTGDDLLTGDDDIISEPPVGPQAGLLTAGEWNDNENWGFFSNLAGTNKITFPSFGIDPRFRARVTVTGKGSSEPVVNAKVRIYGSGDELLWSAVTDKNGVAYLFTDSPSEFKGIVEYGNASAEFTGFTAGASQTAPEAQQGTGSTGSSEIELELDGKGESYKSTDIMFIVDSTGSMMDEMVFLQKEFSDIAEKTGDANTRYSVNFYRDEGDDYVTKCSDFTSNINDVQGILNEETADGGGDLPEAVDKILEECINSTGWSEKSVKLAFLIFDAPPHEGKEQSLQASVRAAAEKGIRLIPVVASNAERETELFGRAVAIKTGGTYVFLTDDSGVGEGHLEPVIGKYEVEKLNELIIRVINSYKQ